MNFRPHFLLLATSLLLSSACLRPHDAVGPASGRLGPISFDDDPISETQELSFRISDQVEYLVFSAGDSTWRWRIQATSGHRTESEFLVHVEDGHVRIARSAGSPAKFSEIAALLSIAAGGGEIGEIRLPNESKPRRLLLNFELSES